MAKKALLGWIIVIGIIVWAAPGSAEAPSTVATKTLTVEEAVAAGLSADPGLAAAALDAQAARERVGDARYRMLPSLAFSAGYTKLSEEPSSLDLPTPTGVDATTAPIYAWVGDMFNHFGFFGPAINDSKDLRLDLQYSIFAGFRLHEALEIARLQASGAEEAAELSRLAMRFEIRRAYWEAARASANVEALRAALELESVKRDEVEGLANRGVASEADRLDEEARYDRAELTLDDAASAKELSVLVLSSLAGSSSSRAGAAIEYSLVSSPDAQPPEGLSESDLAGDGLAALVEKALANRPEARVAALAVRERNASRVAAKADLYPSLSLTGSLCYADPDPRLFPAQDIFNLSWSVGARLRYDIGGVPAAIRRGAAADADYEKSRAMLERERNAIALDLRKCAVALTRARKSLALTRNMVGQAEEARRTAEAKFENGLARRSEVLQAEIALLLADLAVKNRLFDVVIAQADLLRAGALE